jgi:hypothetical protein
MSQPQGPRVRLWKRALGPLQRRFRRQRAKRIREIFPDIADAHVVDVGGSLRFWHELKDIIRPRRVQIYNIDTERMEMGHTNEDAWISLHYYDGSHLPFEANAADIVICNSVIEHVPISLRKALADEIRRVGRSWIVQTPSRSFPIELHFMLPFLHWIPRGIGRQIARVSPFAVLARVDGRKYFDETQLLPLSELRGYFPEGELLVERAAGIPKSNIVYLKR